MTDPTSIDWQGEDTTYLDIQYNPVNGIHHLSREKYASNQFMQLGYFGGALLNSWLNGYLLSDMQL